MLIKKKSAPAATAETPVKGANLLTAKKAAPAVAKNTMIVKKKAKAPAPAAATRKPAPKAQATATIEKKHEAPSETKGQAPEVLSKETTIENVAAEYGSALIPAAEMARVNFNQFYKHGLEGYSSVSVGVSLTIPCAVGEVDQAYDFATGWVSTRMDALMVEIGAREPDEVVAE